MWMVLKSNQVNKVFVGMSKEDANKLMTEKCEKCGHLVDDHLRPMMKEVKGKFIESKGKYVCRNCGCKII